MICSGLVSITFRQLTPQAIVDLVAQSGLDAIEWGGDVHVPHGDVAQARLVRQMTEEAGLAVAAYGSYYRVGHGEPVPFKAVVKSAVALGAPTIRVWAGKQGTATADAAYWARVVEDSRAIGNLAQQAGIVVAYEYHGNTLTDTNASALRLLRTVAHDNVKTYWQPPGGATLDENLAGLDAILPWLVNVHVFSWREINGQCERMLLNAKADEWAQYLDKITATGRDHFAMIEFVRDDDPANFLKDAETLKCLIRDA
ncbi:MAG: TIM barrel protein [Anaerolineae bacterium]|nr:TIM barrel protein [Anaerolineae bacterium]